MDPVIKGDLTPVTIDNKGTVRKADLNEAWYSYSNKEWANSIILQNSYESLSAYGKVHGGATLSNDHVTLDGTDDYIDLGLENYDFQNGITLAIKLKFNDLSGTQEQEFLGNWESAGGGCDLTSEKIYCRIRDTKENQYINVTSQTLPDANADYTILFTYDNNTLKLYINGEEVDSQPYSEDITKSKMPIFIGANPEYSDAKSYSNIDVYQVAIFDRAITEEEANKIKQDIKITDSNGLLKYVDFTNKKSENYEPKEVIPEEVIESYFVWIPKYRYQLFNLGNYKGVTELGSLPSSASVPNNSQEIKIKFGDYNTKDGYKECETPTTSDNGNCKVGDYMTHPAFKAFEGSTGFWIGKFDTGYLGANSTAAAQVNQEETSKIIVKPNVYSWRGINVSNAHLNSYNYKRELDSHMIKNIEWGAMAYLTNSRFGRCNGVTCEEVRMNNNKNYITGYSAKDEPTCGYTGATNESCNRQEGTSLGVDGINTYNYFNKLSLLSSTTKNYSGIYDTAGPAWTKTMGFSGNPEFNDAQLPDPKYYDIYSNTEDTDYTKGHLGDATKELGPFYSVSFLINTEYTRKISGFYSDYAQFPNNIWINRGGTEDTGVLAGTMGFSSTNSLGTNWESFRIILTPTK